MEEVVDLKGGNVIRRGSARRLVFLSLVLLLVLGVGTAATAVGGSEYGLGLNLTTSFGFGSLAYGFDAYARFGLGMLAWELALGTSTGFDSLHIQTTLATLGTLYLGLGLNTYLLPLGSFGSTYLFGGVGLAMGQAMVTRLAVNVAVSISSYGFYPFLLFRFQIGLDP
jgi:hypothetical protein